MHVLTTSLVSAALALTVVPGLKTIAKAQHPEPSPPAIALSLPKCARPAQHKIVSSFGCQMNDAECICSKKDFLPRLLSATSHSCSLSDQEAVKQFGAAYCGIDPSTVTTVPTATPTVLHTPTVTYKCSPIGTAGGSMATDSSTLTIGGKTSTKMMEATKTTTSTTRKPTNGSTDGIIGNVAVRVETGLSAAALAGAIAALGWAFAEL